MLLNALTIAGGIAVVLLLGEVIIRNAIGLARIYHISGTFIGLTILSIGTSIPEIMTHVVGSFTILRQPEMMDPVSGLLIGTNIGSDIFQQIFVLPLIGIIGVVVVVRRNLVPEMGALLGAAVLVWVLGMEGVFNRVEGFILVTAYLAYLVFLARDNHIVEAVANNGHKATRRVILSGLLILLCFIIMSLVTERIVVASVAMVEKLPISASFFGVIILGIASALPELTTALISIYKGEKEISAGILIGSNITNPLLGIGLGAIISRYTVPDVIIYYDLPLKIITAIMLYVFLWRHEDLTKKEAFTLLAIFFVYIYLRQAWFPTDTIHS